MANQDRGVSDSAFGLRLAAEIASRSDEAGTGGATSEPDAVDPFEGEATDIEAEFRRRLAGTRGRSHQQKSGILRAAFEWKQTALRALRDKRAHARGGKHSFSFGRRLTLF